jgi:ketosteroid isomerase-like protein
MRKIDAAAAALCAWCLSVPAQAQTKAGLSPADTKAIDESTQVAVKAALGKDFAAWAALFVDDGVLYPPNQPAVKGRAAIQAWLANFPPITEFKLANVKIEGRGDLAYVLGTFTITIAPPGAPGPIKDVGKFVEVRKRQADGRWLVAVDMFSSDLPLEPPK